MISMPMLKKEINEWFSTQRFLIVCVVFILLTVAQPISAKMLPTLIANSNNLPEGSVIQIPIPPVTEILGSVVRQFDIMGYFVIVLVVMNTIAGERLSGVAAMVLVKPLNRAQYFFSKALSYNLLMAICFFLALIITGYYTEVIFETSIDWGALFLGTAVFIPNLFLVVSLILFCSSFIKSPIGAGGLAFASILVLNFVPAFFGTLFKEISPRGITEASANILMSQGAEILVPLLGSLSLNAIFLICGWQIFKRQEI